MILSFSETVDVYSFNVTQFTLQNRERFATEQYSLSEESYVVLDYGPVVTISLATSDLNELKIILDLATNTSNTFINITEDALADRNSNRVVPTNTTYAVVDTAVIQDENIPMLESFSLDMNLGILHLMFSETVQASSINVTEISLQNENIFNINTTTVYNLTGGTVSVSDGPEITIQLSDFDLNEIKLITDLATESEAYENVSTNTFLTLTSLSVRDNNLNQIQPILSSNATPITEFTTDTTNVILRAFSLDLNSALLTLNFSEAVNATTLNFTAITLRNIDSDDNDTVSLTLSDGTIATLYQTIVMINLTDSDLDQIKDIDEIANDVNDTYLDILYASVYDNADNPLEEITLDNALQATAVIRDISFPMIESFDLDMNTGYIILTFTEAVKPEAIDPTGLTLQSVQMLNGTSDNNLFYTLTTGNASRIDRNVVNFSISIDDLNRIKQRPALAVDENSTFLSYTEDAAVDTSGNPVVARSIMDGLPVANFTQDTTKPELQGFDFDLDRGTLILRFSETVSQSSLNITLFQLLDSLFANASVYNFTGN